MPKPWARGAHGDEGLTQIAAVEADTRDGPIIASTHTFESHGPAVENRARTPRRGLSALDFKTAFRLSRLRLRRIDIGDPDAFAARQPEGIAVGHIADGAALRSSGRAGGPTGGEQDGN